MMNTDCLIQSEHQTTILNVPSSVIQARNCTTTSTLTITEQDQTESCYTELRLLGQTVTAENPDCRHCIKRKNQSLPPDNEKRIKIDSSTNVVEEPQYKIFKLFGTTFIVENPDFRGPCVPRKEDGLASAAESGNAAASNLQRMRFFQGNYNENDSAGVSKLSWTMRKKLEASDVGHMSRLLVGKEAVHSLLQLLKPEEVAEVHSGGLNVEVCDSDNGGNNVYTLKLKLWSSSKSYVFIEGWSRHFVKRRGLRQGDEIELCWDVSDEKIYFRVL